MHCHNFALKRPTPIQPSPIEGEGSDSKNRILSRTNTSTSHEHNFSIRIQTVKLRWIMVKNFVDHLGIDLAVLLQFRQRE